ncbi:hypothetical protein JK358_06855 [Nocardia sp. 2]|uniref:Mce-associated membrane protein n=1 Tax=Nocardia acididurans TaxID=2802282 RepID=A0ABS1M0S3_9NOCA|nr:hypothetical protein [Nocardia acididurans]MBL1074111.1 hypothetical protein [Nocardia acididurans]
MSVTEKTPESVVPLAKNADEAASESSPSATVEPVQSEPAAQPTAPSPVAAERALSSSVRERVVPVLAGLVAVLAVLGVALGFQWRSAAGDLNDLRAANADRDRAAEVASDYTLRSLTYDYKNVPAFFDGVQRGTSDALRNRYTEVHDTLSKIMTEAQVVATGQVVGTSVQAQGNDQYTVTVYATQRTQNIQQQDPATVPNLLTVTVAKNDGDWLVVDYGPKDVAATNGAAK